MNRKKVICLKQHKNNENSIEEILQLNISRNFLKCINYAQRGFNVFWFVTCKVSVDAFSFVYSKLFFAKFSLFVFGGTFAEWH